MAEPHPLSLLIVEDEAMVLSLLWRGAEAAGCIVRATASSVSEALARFEALSGEIDAVLLDSNLHGVPATPVADRLRAAGVPFLVITGYTAEYVMRITGDAPILRKPFRTTALAEALRTLPRR
ncbi:response regulator [Acuticoccus sediminis]|uniref:response regulator n=1 Tax=Acuticoccus sediminis TaxID=2184697 RepID=UPI001CFDE4A8|nr:response regulator [Acuticoccus sediminis]